MRILNQLVTIASLLALSACNTNATHFSSQLEKAETPLEQKLVGIDAPVKEQTNMEIKMKGLLASLQDPEVFNESTCSEYLGAMLSEMKEKAFSEEFIEISEEAYLKFEKPAPRVIDSLFKVRLAAKRGLDKMENPSKECVSYMRELQRASRYAEETLAEWYVTRVQQKDISGIDFDTTNPVQVQVNPKYYEKAEDFRFKSGDILLVRGSTFVSATIARIADQEGQFSHLAMVYKPEPGTKYYGKTYVIEALIETGVILRTLDSFLEQGHTRHAVYRLKGDAAQFAHEAGAKAFESVMHQMDKFGNPYEYGSLPFRKALLDEKTIPYNFTMDLDQPGQYCSQLVRDAILKASGGNIVVPTHLSTLNKLNGYPLLEALTVTTTKTFAPTDIELDRNSELVAEYRNLTKEENGLYKTQTVKAQDAFFTVFLNLMVTNDYRINNTWVHDQVKRVARLGKFVWNNILGIGTTIIPADAPADFMDKAVAMQFMQEDMMEALFEHEMMSFQRVGFSTPYNQLIDTIEWTRKLDCIDYMATENFYLKRQIESVFDAKDYKYAYVPVIEKVFGENLYHDIFRPEGNKSCLDPSRTIKSYTRESLKEMREELLSNQPF